MKIALIQQRASRDNQQNIARGLGNLGAAARNGAKLACYAELCNRVGQEDRFDFAGESFVCAPDGAVIARAGRGTEENLYADVPETSPAHAPCRVADEVTRALQWLAKPDGSTADSGRSAGRQSPQPGALPPNCVP